MFPPPPKIRVKTSPISALKKIEKSDFCDKKKRKKYLYCRGVYFTF